MVVAISSSIFLRLNSEWAGAGGLVRSTTGFVIAAIAVGGDREAKYIRTFTAGCSKVADDVLASFDQRDLELQPVVGGKLGFVTEFVYRRTPFRVMLRSKGVPGS